MAKKLVRKAGQKSLKSQGAGYSTTNRKGETTFYKSSKDAPGYNDTTQSRSDMSAGNAPISKFDSTGKVITSASLAPTKPYTFPTQTAPSDVGNMVAANNQGLSSTASGVTADAKGMMSVAPPVEDKYSGLTAAQDAYTKSIMQLNAETPTSASIQKDLERETGIKKKEQAVNDLSGQLNTIVANRDAQILSAEGQGRGVPEAIIGGQQAQINREAAIAALPVQAQLAAAQGSLELAQSHINTWGKLLMDDAANKYNQKRDLYKSTYDFVQGRELARIKDLEAANERTYQETQSLIKAKTSAIANALGQGAPQSVANAIQSATDMQGVAIAAGQYNGDVLGRQIQQAQLNKLNAKEVAVLSPLQLSQAIQESVQDSNPVTIKSSIATLLGSNKIAAGTKARISPGLAVLNAVDEFANMNPEGKFTGVGIAGRTKEWFKGLVNMKSPEAITNSQNIEAVNLKVQQWASGAALTDAQTKQVDRFTPTLNDSDKAVKSKLNGLYNFMLNQAEADLLSDGINVQFPAVNLFEISDLYAKASPEQRAIIESTYFKKN